MHASFLFMHEQKIGAEKLALPPTFGRQQMRESPRNLGLSGAGKYIPKPIVSLLTIVLILVIVYEFLLIKIN